MTDDNHEATPPEYRTDPSIQRAQLGIEAEVFKKSNLFRFMVERSKLEVDRLTLELVETDAADEPNNRRIRQKIAEAKGALIWLREAIQSGTLARAQLNEADVGS
jgi:hypothetical protein